MSHRAKSLMPVYTIFQDPDQQTATLPASEMSLLQYPFSRANLRKVYFPGMNIFDETVVVSFAPFFAGDRH